MKLNLKTFYTEDLLWLTVWDDEKIFIGLTGKACQILGDIAYIDYPELNRQYKAGETFAFVETIKTSTEIKMPIDGKCIKTQNNGDLPEKETDGIFLAEFEGKIPEDTKLMTEEEYKQYLEELQ